ncbi:MAG: hypothetical protein JWP91_2070 [Fibrobacteres bacterium]|nr:hypothetical protein [Fibrobacterota bacterium]
MSMKSHSPLENAKLTADKTGTLIGWAKLMPLPVLAAAVVCLQIGAPGHAATAHAPRIPSWYNDPFLLIMFAIFAYGQVSALIQLRVLSHGLKKVKLTLGVLLQARGISLAELQTRLQSLNLTGHLYDLINRSLMFGMKGDTVPLAAMMDHATMRRMKSVDKKVGVHASVNRILLKLGFLGTLIGLIMTFPPMREAILTLDPKNAEKGSSFVEHIAGAIDGDQYAILATLIATALSILIELLTIQVLKRICGTFEMVNGFVDEWSITDLQPWIREQVGGKDDLGKSLMQQQAFQQKMLDLEREFQGRLLELKESSQKHITALYQGSQENWMRLHKDSESMFLKALKDTELRIQETQLGVNKNVDMLGGFVQHIAQKMGDIPPLQLAFAKRMDELLNYERQYRSFLEVQSQISVPRHLKPEIN